MPAGKKIIPGVIDFTSNTVEHPEVVADRILNFASVVGRENVVAGVDCGFGTFAGRVQVDTKIVWLKLQSLSEGARRVSKQLWTQGGLISQRNMSLSQLNVHRCQLRSIMLWTSLLHDDRRPA